MICITFLLRSCACRALAMVACKAKTLQSPSLLLSSAVFWLRCQARTQPWWPSMTQLGRL